MYRYRCRRYSRMTPRQAGAALAAGLALAALASTSHPAAASTGHHQHAQTSHAAAVAITYAEHQIGKPYCWGGTGPSCYDCSGLVQRAWAAAGVQLERTSEDQWASLRHVASPAPGDLVFAPGSDGSWSAPGHVGLYLGHGRVEQAYATGYPIAVTSLARFGAGAGGIVGYAEVN